MCALINAWTKSAYLDNGSALLLLRRFAKARARARYRIQIQFQTSQPAREPASQPARYLDETRRKTNALVLDPCGAHTVRSSLA